MKTSNKIPRILVAACVAGSALAATGSAFAYSDRVIVSEGPAPYAQAQMMPVGVSINIGWHGDRYWDGHRYWAHDDWMRRHPHDSGPRYYHDDHGHPHHD